jgi:hypothetical protein
MGSMNVYDDGSQSYGSIGSSIASAITGAPAKAAAFTHMIETIKDQRIARERAQTQWDATLGAANSVDAATPQAVAPTSTMTVPGPYVGDPASDPGVTRDLPTADLTYTDPIKQKLAEDQRKLAVAGQRATVLADPKQWAQQNAYGTVAAAGVPTDPYARARLDFLAGKGMPTHIGTDESKSPVKNWVPVNEKGEAIGQIVSSSVKPPGNYALSTAVSPTPPNPIESVPIAQNNFNQLAEKIQAKIAAGQPVSDVELNAARAMRDGGWQKEIKIEKNQETGQYMPLIVYKIPPPTAGPAAGLMQLLDSIDGRSAAAAPAVPPAVPPTATGAGAATPPVPAVVPPTAPAPATGSPLVQLQPSIGPGEVNPVAQRYLHNPVIVSMENAKNGYSSFIGNVNNNDPAADLALVIGAAKVLDPPSVVREGEVENVKKTGGIMDKYIGMINQAATGESGLTKEVRAQLWNMVNEKLKLDVANAKAIREQHLVQLSERNIQNPDKYLPPLPDIIPVDWNKISNYTIRNQRPGTDPAPITAPSAPTARRSADDILSGR